MLWLCVYFPQLGLELGATPEVAQPAVLLADNRVIQRNELARQRGIHIGTSLAAAHSIATDLLHIQRNPALESTRLDYLQRGTGNQLKPQTVWRPHRSA